MAKDKQIKLLSIVIPCYKEEKNIAATLANLEPVLKSTGLKYEIIPVVDGILDSTYDILKKIKSPHIRSYAYQKNRGKGHAVRYGMARAKGDVIGFIDANGISPSSLLMLLQHYEWYDADIIIGSKRHPVSKVKYAPIRRVISFFSQILIKTLLGINVRDTQVGIKIFKREVLERVLPRLLVKEFAFDVEVLAVANHLGFTHIYEAPVELKDLIYESSSVLKKGFLKSHFLALRDTLAVFYRMHILHYYDDTGAENWRRNPDLEFWRPSSSKTAV